MAAYAGKPRRRRYLPMAFALFAAVALVVSVAAVFLGWRSAEMQRQLLLEGTQAWGVVTDRMKRPGTRGGDNLVVRYAWVDQAGERRSAEAELPPRRWEQASIGSKMAITYLPASPTVHVREHLSEANAGRPLREALGFAAGTLGVTLLAGVLVYFARIGTPTIRIPKKA